MSDARDPARPDAAATPGEAVREPAGWIVRRVVVAVDASPGSAAAARQAARLASRLSAELCGFFVEDPAVLRLAGLPVCIEVGTFSATSRRLAPGDLERRLRSQAGRARRQLEESALAAAVADFRFEVLRGEAHQALADTLGEADLLSLGRAGATGLARLGSFARAALAGRRGQLLLLPAHGRIEPPAVAVFGDTPGARRALAAALRLFDHDRAASLRRGALTLLLVAADEAAARELEAEARGLLAEAGLPPPLPRFRHARPGDRHALAQTVRLDRAHVLLLPAESPLVRPEDLEEVIAGLDCSVLVVR
ncbi:MAG TPA: universal stress protein [Thermoanaerobaculia bacterium]